jgi:hypothetical protein
MYVPVLFLHSCEPDELGLEMFIPQIIQVLNIHPCLVGQIFREYLIIDFSQDLSFYLGLLLVYGYSDSLLVSWEASFVVSRFIFPV